MSERVRVSLTVITLVVVTLVIYLPALWTNGFVYEDAKNLSASVMRERHLVNLALHLATGLLVYRLTWLLGLRSGYLAAAVVLWHPIQVETVAYAASVPHLKVAAEIMLAAVIAAGPFRWWRVVGIVVVAYFAHRAYPSGLLCLPFVLLLWLPRLRRMPPKIVIPVSIGVAIGTFGGFLWLPDLLKLDAAHQGVSRLDWLLIQTRALELHTWHFLFPLGGQWCVVHDAMAQPIGLVGLVASASVVVTAVWMLRRSLWALIWLAWIGMVIAPRLIVREVTEPLAEHHLYMAVIGIGMLLAMGVDRVIDRQSIHS